MILVNFILAYTTSVKIISLNSSAYLVLVVAKLASAHLNLVYLAVANKDEAS